MAAAPSPRRRAGEAVADHGEHDHPAVRPPRHGQRAQQRAGQQEERADHHGEPAVVTHTQPQVPEAEVRGSQDTVGLSVRSSESREGACHGVCKGDSYYAFGLIWLRNIYFDLKPLMVQNCRSQISPNAS